MNNILKTFNTTETWVDVDILANLKGITKRAVRLSLTNSKSEYEYKKEKVKGGECYKIRLSSIEEELQIKYIREYYDTLTVTNNLIELHKQEVKVEKVSFLCLPYCCINLYIILISIFY